LESAPAVSAIRASARFWRDPGFACAANLVFACRLISRMMNWPNRVLALEDPDVRRGDRDRQRQMAGQVSERRRDHARLPRPRRATHRDLHRLGPLQQLAQRGLAFLAADELVEVDMALAELGEPFAGLERARLGESLDRLRAHDHSGSARGVIEYIFTFPPRGPRSL
jgi:hypothetical protein